MDEQQVRALVRQAIARHLGPQPEPAAVRQPFAPAAVVASVPPAPAVTIVPTHAISHARFALVRPAGEVDCVIEPAVTCNHCGYCQCYGH